MFTISHAASASNVHQTTMPVFEAMQHITNLGIHPSKAEPGRSPQSDGMFTAISRQRLGQVNDLFQTKTPDAKVSFDEILSAAGARTNEQLKSMFGRFNQTDMRDMFNATLEAISQPKSTFESIVSLMKQFPGIPIEAVAFQLNTTVAVVQNAVHEAANGNEHLGSYDQLAQSLINQVAQEQAAQENGNGRRYNLRSPTSR